MLVRMMTGCGEAPIHSRPGMPAAGRTRGGRMAGDR